MKWKGNLISCFVYFYFLSLLGSRTKHNWTKPALKNLVPLPKLWLCNQHYTLRLFWFNYMYTELVSVTVLARMHAIIAMCPCSFLYNGKTMTAAWYTNIHVILLAASSSLSLSLSLSEIKFWVLSLSLFHPLFFLFFFFLFSLWSWGKKERKKTTKV